MLKVAITHDIDRITKTYQYLTHSVRALKHRNLKHIEYNIKNISNWKREYWNFEIIMEVESKYSIKSTFFFLNEPVTYNIFNYKNFIHSYGRYKINNKRVKEIIRTLDENGWEIGVHGSFSSYKSKELLKDQKMELEDILGKKVKGIRQHYLNLDLQKTWEYQSESGFLYDSSWGLTRGIGFKGNRKKPFRPLNNDFIVFPLTIMDYCFMGETENWEKFTKICNDIESQDGILVINWHNCSFNENDYPGSKDAFEEMISRCISRGAVIKRLNEFLKNEN